MTSVEPLAPQADPDDHRAAAGCTGSAQFLDADQIAGGIAEGAVADAVGLLDRLLDDFAPAACTLSKVVSRSGVASVIQP